MANDNNIQPMADDSQIVLYQPDESISLQVKIEEDTVWLTQAQMVELFGSSLVKLILVSTLLIFISKENWCSRQLFGNSEQLEKKAIVWLHVIWITIILI